MMERNRSRSFIWIPRILTFVYILFISLFAFDVFREDVSFLHLAIAFLIHLSPSLILVTIMIATWRRPFMMGAFFILCSIGFTLYFHTYQSLDRFAAVSLPPALTGLLFIASHFLAGKEEREGDDSSNDNTGP